MFSNFEKQPECFEDKFGYRMKYLFLSFSLDSPQSAMSRKNVFIRFLLLDLCVRLLIYNVLVILLNFSHLFILANSLR